MTPQYKSGDGVWCKQDGHRGRVQEVRKDGAVLVLWDKDSAPLTWVYSPSQVDDFIEPIPAEPAPADQPLTDAQVAQIVDAVLAKLAEMQPEPSEPAAPEGDPSRIQVGDTVLLRRGGSEATVVAVHGSEACILMGVAGLYVASIHQLAKVTTHD